MDTQICKLQGSWYFFTFPEINAKKIHFGTAKRTELKFVSKEAPHPVYNIYANTAATIQKNRDRIRGR